MNRRDFAKSLAALGLAPALPAFPATTAPGYTPYMYGLGAHLARSMGGCSVTLLAQKLRLAPEVAQAMQAQLLRNGVITASKTGGLAVAAQPYMRSAPLAKAASAQAGKALHAWMDQRDDTPAPEADDQEPVSSDPAVSKDQP